LNNLLFSDIHLKDDRLEDQAKIFDFIVYKAIELKVKRVYFLGDGFHERKNITVACLNLFRKFVLKLNKHGISFYAISGNHDKPFDDAKISALDVFGNINNMNKVVTNGFLVEENILLLPFAPAKDLKRSLKNIAKNYEGIKYIFTHTGIKGVKLNKGYISKTKLRFSDFTVFKKLKKVFLGDYHDRIEKGRFIWIGSAMQLKQGEIENKYIYIFDNTSDYNLRSIETEFPKFLTYEIEANKEGIERAFHIVKRRVDCFVRIIFYGDRTEILGVPKKDLYAESKCRFLDVNFEINNEGELTEELEIKDDILKMFKLYSKQEKMHKKVRKIGIKTLEKLL
jgi:DNA repair exonuclease SbcCD nuclease subunit